MPVTVRFAVRVEAPNDAVTVAVCGCETPVVWAVNTAAACPANMVTLGGTVTAGLLLTRSTTNPPVGA